MGTDHGTVTIDASGWLVGVRRLPSPNCDARPPGAVVELVVVHAISLPPGRYGGDAVERLFTNRLDHGAHPYFAALEGMRVSAHLYIERSGAMTQFVPFALRAWHAGRSCWAGRSACNDFSIGIELEGCDDDPFTAAQYRALARVLRSVMAHYPGIDPSRIVGHADVAPGRKTDPGPHFDWSRLRASLAAGAVGHATAGG